MKKSTIYYYLTFFLLASFSLNAKDIHVSTSVATTGQGTETAPYKTIQEAAKVAVAGDRVIIHAGTYRESVTPINSGTASARITYMPYNNDIVVIDGSDLVTGWTLYKDNIYRASYKMTLFAENQLYINGKMGHLARWPNVSEASVDDPFFVHTNYSTANSGSTATKIIDSKLPSKPVDFYKGCTMWGNFGVKWTAFGTTITASSGTQLTYAINNDAMHAPFAAPYSPMVATNKELYYLSGKFELLDAYNEWFFRNDSVYLMAKPDVDLNLAISAKKRHIVFNLTGKSNITVKNIYVFGGTIIMKNTIKCTLDGINAKFISHHSMAGVTLYALRYQQLSGRNGFEVSGSSDTIMNCVIKYSAGGGITVAGTNQVIDNNDIQYTNYVNSYCEAINSTDGSCNNIFITRNKLWHAGGPLINAWSSQNNTKGNKIFYNDVAFGEQLGDDRGGINGSNYEVAYNWVHDIGRGLGSSIVPGLYTDVSSDYSTYHHNVIWNMHPTNTVAHIMINDTGNPPNGNQETYIYNNTGYGKGYNDNTMTAGLWQKIITDKNNLCNPIATTFVDVTKGDFRLRSTATNAIDKAVIVPYFTDGFVGLKPDLGAYEYGQSDGRSDWKAGLNVTMYYPNFIPPATVTARGETLPNEGALKIYDQKPSTKWVDNSTTSWVQFEFTSPEVWNALNLTSGNDLATKTNDPRDWILKASNDGLQWANLDTITNNSFAARSSVYTFAFNKLIKYKFYRFEISANNGGDKIELAEIKFSFSDIVKPTIPTTLVFSPSFILSWKASTDNMGAVSYEIFNNGISLGKSTTNTFSIPKIKPLTEYNFTVKAGDESGNWSAASTVLTTTTGTFTNYEAENAIISGGGINNNHAGFSGTGFWDNVGVVGNSIEFTVSSTAGRSTEVNCRYSSGDAIKTLTLYVNGIKLRAVSFPSTAGWTNWSTKIENVNLNTGNNTITFKYDSGNTGYLNIDYIQVKPNITGISGISTDDNLKIYPNPASTQITIENIDPKAFISICSIDGKVLYKQQTINFSTATIDISNLKSGIYFVKVVDGISTLTKKIVIDIYIK